MKQGEKIRVGVAGSLVLDILPVLGEQTEAEDIMAEGKLTEASGVKLYLGGEVGNMGLALQHLGAAPVLISKIGDDMIGDVVRLLMEKEGADARVKRLEGCRSTVSIALAIPGRDKSTIHSRGASQQFVADDLSDEILENLDWLHFGYPTTMKSLYENDGEELLKLLEKAEKHGVKVSLDTSLPDLKAEAGQVDWRRILPKLLPHVEIFLPSAEESMFLFHREYYQKLMKEHRGQDLMEVLKEEEIEQIAKQSLAYGVGAVLIKCGKKGMYLRTRETFGPSEAWRGRSLWQEPYPIKQLISTTGAGDTAIAGFLQSYFKERTPEQALKMAAFTASLCIESYDTVSKIKKFEEMERIAYLR